MAQPGFGNKKLTIAMQGSSGSRGSANHTSDETRGRSTYVSGKRQSSIGLGLRWRCLRRAALC